MSLHLSTLKNKQRKDDKWSDIIRYSTKCEVGFWFWTTAYSEFDRPAIVWYMDLYSLSADWVYMSWNKSLEENEECGSMKLTAHQSTQHYFPLTANSWHHFLPPQAESLDHPVQPPSQFPSPLVLEMALFPFRLLASPQKCFVAQLLHFLHKAASCHEAVLDMMTGLAKRVMDIEVILPSQDWDSLMSHTGLEPWIVRINRLTELIWKVRPVKINLSFCMPWRHTEDYTQNKTHS